MHLTWLTYLKGTLRAPYLMELPEVTFRALTYLEGTLCAPYMVGLSWGTLRALYMADLPERDTSCTLLDGPT